MSADEHTTDRHDESDRAQFGDDHDINGTHFIATHCQDCGTYVVRAPEATQAYCIDCRRNRAGIDFGSGDNVGEHHPTIPSATPTTTTATFTEIIARGPHNKTEWRWGCLYCRETGQADNPTHAEALHKIHLGYACPGAPGLYPSEIKLRLARRKAREHLYPEDVPPFTPNNENE